MIQVMHFHAGTGLPRTILHNQDAKERRRAFSARRSCWRCEQVYKTRLAASSAQSQEFRKLLRGRGLLRDPVDEKRAGAEAICRLK